MKLIDTIQILFTVLGLLAAIVVLLFKGLDFGELDDAAAALQNIGLLKKIE